MKSQKNSCHAGPHVLAHERVAADVAVMDDAVPVDRHVVPDRDVAVDEAGAELDDDVPAAVPEREAIELRAHDDAEELAKRLTAVTLVFKLKAGEHGKTFGSVTAKEVAEALKKEAKADIDKTKIVLHEPLRSLGVHKIEVRLLPDVRADVTVAIEPA